ncbi:hypothetical protein Busp01_17250 [Trinickia caryophylli]|uniref:Uncharacterized protein n=1 Tax=Trinickia caryophylli TaxID=28094 RepID=A0A1X7H997_TRICW|nr:hypothetical protein Busp01_17250 [Trinickia caryophylli]SMF81950.1 hypothetical protein SAMN06295900_12437 [Trinickia caryophylli]
MHEANCARAMFGAFISVFTPRARQYPNGHIRVTRQASPGQAVITTASAMRAESVIAHVAADVENYFPNKTGISMSSPQSG